jgi:hypothetical protein
MYVRFDEQTQQPTVTIFTAKDVDTGFLPDARHVEFAELLSALEALSKVIEEFESLAGFRSDAHSTAEKRLKKQPKNLDARKKPFETSAA